MTPLLLAATTSALEAPPLLQVGAAKVDITVSAVGEPFMGFGEPSLHGNGIHTHLYARAFVFIDGDGHRLALVSSDLGMTSELVHQEVLAELQREAPGRFPESSVLLTATHTHAGPGGYFGTKLYNVSSGGFSDTNFLTIVDGMADAIVDAEKSALPGTAYLATGDLMDASVNQSRPAYDRNADRGDYTADRNTTMTLLGLRAGTALLGEYNWFSVHPTTLGPENRLMSGDNKGVAAWLLEHEGGLPVAAFGNSDEGDISSDTFSDEDESRLSYIERTAVEGERQAHTAMQLLTAGGEPLSPVIDTRLAWVRMPGFQLRSGAMLCNAALGLSFAAGSEDGPSHVGGFLEGMRADAIHHFPFPLTPLIQIVKPFLNGKSADRDCQFPKPILISNGDLHGWMADSLPFELARIGELVIIGVPGEMTTMAGRRLRALVLSKLEPLGVRHAVIAGLANSYSGYITTPEEYELQDYEGASTLYGPHTLQAYLEIFDRLTDAMAGGADWTGDPTPTFPVPKLRWRTCDAAALPELLATPSSRAVPGATVFAEFKAKVPCSFTSAVAQVEVSDGATWRTVEDDTSPRVVLEWKGNRVGISWFTPSTTSPGDYRLVLEGKASSPIRIEPPERR